MASLQNCREGRIQLLTIVEIANEAVLVYESPKNRYERVNYTQDRRDSDQVHDRDRIRESIRYQWYY